jgi:hypothetical protein
LRKATLALIVYGSLITVLAALAPGVIMCPDDRGTLAPVAEDMEKVNPDLVVRDAKGKVNPVRYEAVNAMLLNEFLKEHRKVEKLEATIEQQERNFQSAHAEQEKKIEALTTGLQRVSAQLAAASPSDSGLEMSKSAPKTDLNQ